MKVVKIENFKEIMPLTSSGTEFSGYVTAMKEDFYVHLIMPGKSNSGYVYLKGSLKLQQLLEPLLESLKQRLRQCGTIEDILIEIQNVLEQQVLANEICSSIENTVDCCTLLQQLQDCGWDKVHYISSNLDCVHLKAIDNEERKHILKVWIPEKFPHEAPKCEYDLPQEFLCKWLSSDSLLDLFISFYEYLLKFSSFWDNMDEIDENTWVLEPENPNKKDCKRRIAIAPTASLLLIVDPLCPTSVPTCHFLGPDRIVQPVREKFNKNLYMWNKYESVLLNLKQILEIEFPSPTTSNKEEFCVECGICYSYQLNNAIPVIACDDPDCNQPYHHTCIYEYIRTLPNMRHGFNKLFGECPYCGKSIWCTVP